MVKKNKTLTFTMYIIFFASGGTGLVYQVVWIRQLLVIFGSTTHSTVAVLASFMAGLALGSYLIGKFSDRAKNLLLVYGVLEFLIGIFSFSTLFMFPAIRDIYKSTHSLFSNSLQLVLAYKFILASLAILPATVAMGGTLPTLITFFAKRDKKLVSATSRLYAINTLGAVVGTILTAYFLIEILGLKLSLILSVSINILISIVIVTLSKSRFFVPVYRKETPPKLVDKIDFTNKDRLVLVAFGASGLISLCYEVLWTRLLTPSTGTFIYAFAGVLSVYLLGIAIGSYLFEFLFEKSKSPVFIFGLFEAGIGLSAIASILVNSNFINIPTLIKVFLTIIPGTLLMGMTFPVVIKYFSKKKKIGETVGISYAGNTIGSIFGSVAAAYLVIPIFGTIKGIVILGIFNFVLALILTLSDNIISRSLQKISVVSLAILIVFSYWLIKLDPLTLQSAKIKQRIQVIRERGNYEEMFLEDEVATVLGYSQIGGTDKALLIDGVQTTSPGPDTTLLAHLPISIHPNPQKMLVIAFGMGGTYRSALIHPNLSVDAVDLVPSVPKMFHLFHADAETVLTNPRGRIFIDDGRNYARTTKEKYDIIVVDPPPPVNAAGTTVLYSREFYHDSKRILNDGGLFVAWFYTGASVDDFTHLFRSFIDEFPNVLAINSVITSGFYLIGSEKPIPFDQKIIAVKLTDPIVYADNNKTLLDGTIKINIPLITIESICERILGDREVISKFVDGAEAVSDDRPITEYFLLRTFRNNSTLMRPEYIEKFNDDIHAAFQCGASTKEDDI
ncbi:hypothetical protein A2962_03315 [Candidatus Woesebacteria bacterium RIFCSPLOWO2_01_FULL_39_61]|nr:MAG: hypothetical protein A2692_04400 [Candidatus Woesebacteria bacterium RIFCSPHIGHO2_01_FULL_39_95]OGM67518.1 MAG: hypothetical protein A2962_03315 [Candidatus Woesebacteria bacterium RIFCSPLOWO2_01_FULL_39_61]